MSETPDIVFLDRATLGPDIALRPPSGSLRCHDACALEDRAQRLAGVRVAITNKVPLDAELLGQLPDLRLIAVAATGVDIVDLEACRARGIDVCNVRDYAGTSVAEHVLAVVLALRRNLFAYRQDVQDGAWQRSGQFWFYNGPVHDLAGSRLGIIGTGSIAREVGRLATAFRMTVAHHSPSGRSEAPGLDLVSFDELLETSDVISCHTPLTPATRGMLGEDALGRLPGGALVVNTARGAIVDLDALERHLASGHLGGAAIDVAPEEPPPAGSAVMRLAERRDVIVTPHSAWASLTCRQALADQLIDVVDGWLAGDPRNLVVSREIARDGADA